MGYYPTRCVSVVLVLCITLTSYKVLVARRRTDSFYLLICPGAIKWSFPPTGRGLDLLYPRHSQTKSGGDRKGDGFMGYNPVMFCLVRGHGIWDIRSRRYTMEYYE
ncbi:hypothetical protein ASPVEDRAFT_690642 [Aspergillus versicolor CBS 583.65]|uniref:Uncharacterized protein n=1 Tax=Aspergillus versicolor CBS 583.65 TaxID=1036611 RepID=A0A1L9PMK1_ASPVE|nr:uncharacterized protein ASPVEDRAFT_690642 [Aspergillus versicolor CBS 583.65]OJJ02731.1 hypothetical protein ASPVEDRAFT_690642 [Aspergillus versicolor CBS 583.65]